jgi:hypothetical protein
VKSVPAASREREYRTSPPVQGILFLVSGPLACYGIAALQADDKGERKDATNRFFPAASVAFRHPVFSTV